MQYPCHLRYTARPRLDAFRGGEADVVVRFVDALDVALPLGHVLGDEHVGDAASHLGSRQRARRRRIEIGDGRRGPPSPQVIHGGLGRRIRSQEYKLECLNCRWPRTWTTRELKKEKE